MSVKGGSTVLGSCSVRPSTLDCHSYMGNEWMNEWMNKWLCHTQARASGYQAQKVTWCIRTLLCTQRPGLCGLIVLRPLSRSFCFEDRCDATAVGRLAVCKHWLVDLVQWWVICCVLVHSLVVCAAYPHTPANPPISWLAYDVATNKPYHWMLKVK